MIIEEQIRAIMPMILDKNFSRAEKEEWIKKVVVAVGQKAFSAGFICDRYTPETYQQWVKEHSEDPITDAIPVEESEEEAI